MSVVGKIKATRNGNAIPNSTAAAPYELLNIAGMRRHSDRNAPRPASVAIVSLRAARFGRLIRSEKIFDRRAERRRDMEKAPGRDAADAVLVFVRLLEGNAEDLGQLLLRHADA